MSKCISGAGEFGEHTMALGNYVCDDCGFDDVEAMFADVQMLRKRLARVTLLAGHDVTMAIDGTRWVEARKVFAAATGNDAGEVAGGE